MRPADPVIFENEARAYLINRALDIEKIRHNILFDDEPDAFQTIAARPDRGAVVYHWRNALAHLDMAYNELHLAARETRRAS